MSLRFTGWVLVVWLGVVGIRAGTAWAEEGVFEPEGNYEVTYAVGDSASTIANVSIIGVRSIGTREFLVIQPFGGVQGGSPSQGFVDLSSVRTITKDRDFQKRSGHQD